MRNDKRAIRGVRAAVCVAIAIGSIGPARDASAQEPALTAVEVQVIAQRQKALADAAPEGAKLVGYLNCGSHRETTIEGGVKIVCPAGIPYRFPSEAEDVPETGPTIFYDAGMVAFELSGLDRKHRYRVGISWWDFDDNQRTQMVTAGSPDGRLVRIAVPSIRLPNYTTDKQPPAERDFFLPVTFARDGKMQLAVRGVTGANTVISEMWVWQLD